jgi:cobalamin biosynthetic protein CobC
MIAHGGALDAAIVRFGGNASAWLDLSTGINPFAYPVDHVLPAHWQRLPDQGLEKACLGAARTCYGVAGDHGLVSAPGTQALIQILPHIIDVDRVFIVSPTYGEHGHIWALRDKAVDEIDRPLVPAGERPCVVVVNPNNPDGRQWSRETLASVAHGLAARNGWLIVDEAFCDVTPELSVAGAGPDNVIVLRSFGKFFGLAGVRLGFAIAPRSICEAITQWLGPWAVSGPALAIGGRALADTAWIDAMRGRLGRRRVRLEETLAAAGFAPVGATDLFVAHEDADRIATMLAERHILVRQFDHDARWLRFGLPGSEDALARLAKALETS